ncbi:MAG TPA: farnesyl diphosphate synthase [Myxococcota bacterium]|nr:farnesyl diphosphate synthase [Myxococcota bacterium]
MRLPPILEELRLRVEDGLAKHFITCSGPKLLKEAMGYSLFAPGKRVRPILLLAANALFPPNDLDPMPAACAFEFVHTYSLIHDDLPAMDNDDFRRGRPTNHRRFGEAHAILAGDGLLTEAFGLMASSWASTIDPAVVQAIAELATAAGSGGMVGGQVLDVIETRRSLERAEIENVHLLKTGALIKAAVRCGAILGHAPQAELAALTRYAHKIGLAFQVADDILDVVGTKAELGKSVGKDQLQGKTTYVTLLGVDGGRRYARQLTDDALRDLNIFRLGAEPLRAVAAFIAGSTTEDETRLSAPTSV